MYCCVSGCGVVSKHDVTLFPLPIAPAHRRRWLSAINPSHKPSIDAAVCTKHFPNDHLVYFRGKIRLKSKVVPSLFGDNVNQQLLTNPEIDTDKNNDSDNDKQLTNDSDIDKRDVNDSDESEKAESQSDNEPIINKVKKVREVKRKRRSVRNKLSKKRKDGTSSDEEVLSNHHSDSERSSVSLKNGDNCEQEQVILADIISNPDSSVADKNLSSEYNILVTPSIEFYCNDDEPPEAETVPAKHDIEDILTNYQIKQNNIHSRIDLEDVLQTNIVRNDKMAEIRQRNMQESIQNEIINSNQESNNENITNNTQITNEVSKKEEDIPSNQNTDKTANQNTDNSANQNTDKSANQEKVTNVRARQDRTMPIFISVTDTQQISSSSEDETEASRDCVMLLEKVQVNVDPATLMLQDNTSSKAPISLLTSSDESDVILQEQHVDTVEVSDETDEDELPLVKLVPVAEVLDKKKKSDLIGWSKSYDFFCYDCNYTARNRKDFNQHKSEHTKVLQVCDICEYTTASKFQYLRHRRKHKDERRFNCHLCSFKAKHQMSLIYHLKRHDIHEAVIEKLNCDSCDVYQTNNSKWLKRHQKHCSVKKKFQCDNCDYSTKRRTDLRRHMTRKHARSSGDEYKPSHK